MALTELQKTVIRLHLGYVGVTPLISRLEIQARLILDSLTPEIELILVGDLIATTTDEQVFREGNAIATKGSILGKTEIAHQKLTPDVIDDSLLVNTVGTIKLRGNELRKRRQLYNNLRRELANTLKTRLYEDLTVGRRIGYSRY